MSMLIKKVHLILIISQQLQYYEYLNTRFTCRFATVIMSSLLDRCNYW